MIPSFCLWLVGSLVTADAFASLQAAVDHAAATGGTVVLSARTYPLQRTLVLPSNVSLVGQGASSVLYLASGANVSMISNKNTTTGDSNIRLANFKVDGNRAGQTAQVFGIFLRTVKNATLEGLTVTNCEAEGVMFRYVDNSNVRNNNFSYNGLTTAYATSGLNLNGYCDYNVIENNVANNNNGQSGYDGNGIRIGDYSNNNTVRNNTTNGNGRRGIKVQGSYNTVTGNRLENNMGHSLLVGGLQIVGNVIENNTILGYKDMAGIHLTCNVDGVSNSNIVRGNTITGSLYGIEAGFGSQKNQFLNNTVTASRGHGILIRGSSDNLVKGNRVTNSKAGFNGIQLWQDGRTTERNRIEANVCTDTQATKTQAWGLKIDSGVNTSTVINNDLRGNRSGGMSITGSGNTVSGNLI